MNGYERLDVFQRSKKLYPQVVSITKAFPSHLWHLRDQICRSANSIHANVAEGYGRSAAEFRNYLTRSLGSCNEIKSHISDAVAVGAMDSTFSNKLIEEYTVVGKQLYRLRESWK